MRLVVFTGHYPYGVGEEFLEDEIKTAENHFDDIIIVSAAKSTKNVTKYIPGNAKIIAVREGLSVVSRLVGMVLCGFNLRFWTELFCGLRERGIKKAVSVGKKIFLTMDYMRHLKKNQKLWQFDDGQTVYYSYWLDVAATYIAQNKLKLNGLCIARAHGGDCFYNRGYIPFRKQQLKGLDAIFSISQAGKDDILKHYGKYVENLSDKIFVSNLGIEIPQTHKSVKNQQKQKVLVSCSSVIPLKRLDLLIEALSLCEDVNIKWLHFGDGSEMGNITSLANQKLFDKCNVSFELKGRVPNQEVLSFYDNSQVNLFVNCSDYEGIPVSVMEAMVRGIPAIARNVGANSELVNNQNGVLLPQIINSEDLAKAITGILTLNDDEYTIKQHNAIKTVENRFNAKQNYIRFFEQIAEMSIKNE